MKIIHNTLTTSPAQKTSAIVPPFPASLVTSEKKSTQKILRLASSFALRRTPNRSKEQFLSERFLKYTLSAQRRD